MTIAGNVEPSLTATRRHFKALDGLRGVAALAVVTFHFMEMAIYNYSKLFIGHGFLAVDFFFCLSGFVIGYAYDDRVGTMGLWAFFKARLIRLHPMVILGSMLGLIALLFDPFAKDPLAYSASRIALMFLASIFLIPYPAMQERAFNLFSLNAPSWSLFWEYVANIFYAVIVFRFSQRWLVFLTVCAAIALCVVGYQAGALSGGWSGHTFWHGGVRVAYSFLAGLLVYRSKWIIRSKLGFSVLSVLLLLAFVMPYANGGWVREAVVVLFYFPLLIVLGAGATLTPFSEKLCTFAGNLSYPLYMTHYAVIWIFGNYYSTYKPDSAHLALVVTSGVLGMVGFAYLVMVLYDIPVRKYLSLKNRGA
ncbi:acyltransferase family protein [Acidicapsa ligni]|uniref:acyltransferase family protein n=1 Tax=Acidicapsa ligni TaxID=542300 RepID=UPI0021E06034|nr:acyltransferase [Acidicapsa ligni]